MFQDWLGRPVPLLDNDEFLKYAPPESKGAAIAALIERNFWDEVASPASHQGEACEAGTTFASRKRAILAVLRWVQSKREYENIMQHLSTTIGEKGDWKTNEARVITFLAEGEQPREYGYDAGFIPGAQKVIITPSHYAENLHAIYTHLPDAPPFHRVTRTNSCSHSRLCRRHSCTAAPPTSPPSTDDKP